MKIETLSTPSLSRLQAINAKVLEAIVSGDFTGVYKHEILLAYGKIVAAPDPGGELDGIKIMLSDAFRLSDCDEPKD